MAYMLKKIDGPVDYHKNLESALASAKKAVKECKGWFERRRFPDGEGFVVFSGSKIYQRHIVKRA